MGYVRIDATMIHGRDFFHSTGTSASSIDSTSICEFDPRFVSSHRSLFDSKHTQRIARLSPEG